MNINLREHTFRNSKEKADLLEGKVEDAIGILEKFKRGEFYRKGYLVDSRSVSKMDGYILALSEAGLDIGKGDSDFGYQMPLPKIKELTRDLIIFRRNE